VPGAVLLPSTVLTMDPRNSRAEAVGVLDGRIAAVGSAAEVTTTLGEGAERVELDGLCLLPGFIDAHHHYCLAAFDRRMPDLHLPPGSSMEALLTRVEQAARERDSGWVRAQGYDPAKLREGRPPRAEEIDSVCADRPVLLAAFSFHEGVLNTRGFEAMGWDASTPDPRNGALVRDRRGLTGEVAEQAFYVAEARSRDSLLETAADAWLAECEAHGRDLLAHGIVRVGDAAVPPSFDDLYDRAAREGRLPITVHRMPVSAGSLIEARLESGPTGDGPPVTPTGPAKLFMDGSERCALCFSIRAVVGSVGGQLRKAVGGAGLAALRAATRSPTPRRGRDGLLHVGMLFWEEDALDQAVASGAQHGLQIAFHAIGNEAVSRALAAIERSRARLSELPGAPRIEHAIFLERDQPRRIADWGDRSDPASLRLRRRRPDRHQPAAAEPRRARVRRPRFRGRRGGGQLGLPSVGLRRAGCGEGRGDAAHAVGRCLPAGSGDRSRASAARVHRRLRTGARRRGRDRHARAG